jgi:hypothetical protein
VLRGAGGAAGVKIPAFCLITDACVHSTRGAGP